MKLSQLEARLPAMYYSSLEDGGPAYIFESAPGRGKTSVITRFPKIMKRIDPTGTYGLVVVNGASFTLMAALGFMIWETLPNGRTISKFTDPQHMITLEGKHMSEYTGGILFIDEADKLGMDEKKIVGEAALSKVLGTHRLPPGWIVMFAANRSGDRSGSTRDLDHLINRRIRVEIKDDVESWGVWARGEKTILPEVIEFAEENPQLLFEPQPADQRPWCTPRSTHQASIHLRSLMVSFGTDKIPTDPLTIEEIEGGIGKPAAAQLFKTIRLGQEVADYEEVVANPLKLPLPTRPDAMRLMSYKLASRISVKDAKQVLSYVSRMPMEHQAMMVRMATQRNYELAFNPTFGAWCSKNLELVSILSKYKAADKD